MVPPSGDGASPAPIDRPILEFVRTHLASTSQVESTVITDDGHVACRVQFASAYFPASVDEVTLTVRWYTNDDFKVHYREVDDEGAWECRWDRHPNAHNTRDHLHPPPAAATLGDDASWPTDHRDVLSLVLEFVEDRIADRWTES